MDEMNKMLDNMVEEICKLRIRIMALKRENEVLRRQLEGKDYGYLHSDTDADSGN